MDAIDQFTDMLFNDGDTCDYGLPDEADDSVFEKAKSLANKPCCVVKDWVWWDLECSEHSANALEKNEQLRPSLIYGRHVLVDELGRYRPGDQMRSSMLKAFHPPAFFETANTMYILVGTGTRKTVKPNLAARIFF